MQIAATTNDFLSAKRNLALALVFHARKFVLACAGHVPLWTVYCLHSRRSVEDCHLWWPIPSLVKEQIKMTLRLCLAPFCLGSKMTPSISHHVCHVSSRQESLPGKLEEDFFKKKARALLLLRFLLLRVGEMISDCNPVSFLSC